jgi:hypothetical protein
VVSVYVPSCPGFRLEGPVIVTVASVAALE